MPTFPQLAKHCETKQEITKFSRADRCIFSMIPLSLQKVSRRDILEAAASIYRFSWRLSLVLVLGNTLPVDDSYAQEPSDVELVNFAFSNYLGTGFYASDSGEVFILKLPLSTTLRPMTDDQAGWVVRYPITMGTANFDNIIDGDIPDLRDIGTISVIPGIEHHYALSPDWRLVSFFDLGIARDLETHKNIRVLGAGVKSFVNFDFGDRRLTLGNRLLFADQENLDDGGNHSNFAALETGLDYIIPGNFRVNGTPLDLSFYYINYYYLDDLVLVDFLDARISLENKNEIGFTVSLPKHDWLPDNSRIGLGVQVTRSDDLYRLVFGAPFF